MTAALSLFLSGLLLAPAVNGQAYDAGGRNKDAFEYVQPLNTTILGPYGHSEPVYPSRESLHNPWHETQTNCAQPRPTETAGGMLWRRPRRSSPS